MNRTIRTNLACIVAFVLLPGVVVNAQVTKPVTNKPLQSTPVATKAPNFDEFNADASTDAGAMMKYESGVRRLLTERKFAELEKMADADRTGNLKFQGGVWKLYVMYQGLKQPVAGLKASDSAWDEHMSALTEWARIMPDSITPRIAIAEAALIYATKILNDFDRTAPPGSSPSGDLDQRRTNIFHLGHLMLKETGESAVRCPHWYYVMMEYNEAGHPDKAQALFLEAISKEPTYYPFYRLHAIYHREEWDADAGEAEKFATNVADQIGGKEGDIVYFEIAAALDASQSTKYFPVAGLSRQRIRSGYAALEERYGASLHKMNQFAYLAMRAEMMEDAAQEFRRIGNRWDPSVWGSKEYFDLSQNYVSIPTALASIRTQAIDNSRNRDGEIYMRKVQGEVGRQLAPKIMGCMDFKAQGPVAGFEMMFKVAADGSVQEFKSWSGGRFGACLEPQINLSTLKLPAPPKDSYWVRVAHEPSSGRPE